MAVILRERLLDDLERPARDNEHRAERMANEVSIVLLDYLDSLLDRDPPTGVTWMDGFLNGWNAAVENIVAHLREVRHG